MGWSFRRSKKVGPFRVSVSTSGVGVSAGVPGARLGIDSKGRRYFRGGRWGLIFQHFFRKRR